MNLYIKEIYVNETEGYTFGNSGWYETFTDNLGVLFKHLQKEFGKAKKMYIDTIEGPKQVGWVFEKKEKYDDAPEKFTRSVWVEVSATEPQKITTTENVTHPF